jgi:hypothetical protein
MKITLKKYILYSSVFAIFTEEFFFKYIIDWKLLYLIIVVNYIFIIRIKKLKINIYFLSLIIFFFLHGLVSYYIIGIPYNFMLSQIMGITIVGLYFYNIMPLYSKEDLTAVYTKMCLFVALLGYVLYLQNFNTPDYRLRSILREPAHYVIIVIPACYYYFKNKKYLSFAIIFGTLVLSNSSLGYIGCGLMVLIPNLTFKRIGYLLALVPIVFVIFQYIYMEFPFFKMRVDDTYNSLNVINTGKFKEETNLSSYVMIANLFIAKNNISDHPLGSGIGSHHYMHTQVYIKELRPPEYLRKQGRDTDNSFDANSLFTRILSEFGLIGFILVIWSILLASKCFNSKDLYLSQGIFIYFLLKLFRDGHYFPPELFFFIWLFYFSIKEYKKRESIL